VNHIDGIYIDLAVTDFLGFDVRDYEFVGFRDGNSAKTSWKVATLMFYSTKESPILQAGISECVANVRRRFYGKDPQFPTGPSVLGRAVANRSLEVSILIGGYCWLKRRRKNSPCRARASSLAAKWEGATSVVFQGFPAGITTTRCGGRERSTGLRTLMRCQLMYRVLDRGRHRVLSRWVMAGEVL
jgi:hypothetical protein